MSHHYTAEELARLVQDFTPEMARTRREIKPYYFGDKAVAFIPAQHGKGRENPTFEQIDKAFNASNFDLVIVEGVPTAMGYSPPRIAHQIAGLPEARMSEDDYAMAMAAQKNIPFIGGKPTDEEIFQKAQQLGFSRTDMMNYYLLREVPRWNDAWKTEHQQASGDEAIRQQNAFIEKKLTNYLRDPGYQFRDDADKPTAETFEAWYQSKKPAKGKELSQLGDADLKPVADVSASYFQRISAADERATDEHLLGVILEAKNQHKKCLVVYGNSHFKTLEQALTMEVGPERKSDNPVLSDSMQRALDQYCDPERHPPTMTVPYKKAGSDPTRSQGKGP